MKDIPKKIHYCWFGNNKIPDDQKKYIETWKKLCPDYEIKEWNEKNFDINCNKYVKEAYEAKKFAFVSDFVRLYALYNEGGIYMDTDVEVIKPLDSFLEQKAFVGFESEQDIMTGLIGAQKGNEWIKMLLEDYDEISFYQDNGEMDLTTNVERIVNKTKQNYKINLKSSYQELGDVTIYPLDYFCAKDWKTGIVTKTKNTYTIHHFKGSWHTKEENMFIELKRKLINKYDEKKAMKKYILYVRLYNLVRHPIRTCNNLIKKIIKK